MTQRCPVVVQVDAFVEAATGARGNPAAVVFVHHVLSAEAAVEFVEVRRLLWPLSLSSPHRQT